MAGYLIWACYGNWERETLVIFFFPFIKPTELSKRKYLVNLTFKPSHITLMAESFKESRPLTY